MQENTKKSESKTRLSKITFPIKEADLNNLEDIESHKLPQKYRRKITDRIFVNRNVNLANIQYFGFDMDYTLAVYTTEYEHLAYNLAIKNLINMGYPQEITKLKYDPNFTVRGIYVDKKLGNMLKLDIFGYILTCVHGKKIMKRSEIREMYPTKFISTDEIGSRYYCHDTLFGLPEACLYSDLVDFFDKQNSNLESTDAAISYWSLFEDIRQTIHGIHIDGTLKREVLNDIHKYVKKDSRIATLFHRLRKQKRTTFLLTNSEFTYTNEIMKYLLNDQRDDYKDWKDYFDIIIVNAQKPRFFKEGSTLREVDLKTSQLKLTPSPEKKFEKGKVYAGGNLEIFKKLTGTVGSEVIYIGDNIAHDIIFTKESRCLWRTMFIVRELDAEIDVWKQSKQKINHLRALEYLRAKAYSHLDSSHEIPPDANDLKGHIKKQVDELDKSFNKYFGSLFRGGSSESYFASQVQRFADLYASDFLHLLSYPFFYYFSAMSKLYPHESEAEYVMDQL